ncbi:NUDIX hydrolase [Haloarchaeobius sp. HRN-SO-5]|uniref:NUDIX hydrolase n=1 Tax=Haloarchaeobius sp. HRN-SO-5 TaxID=3446118 RepID=UPI003EBC4544
MVNFPPEFCPYCGAELGTVTHQGEPLLFCDPCDRPIFHNPVPGTGVVVVDDDRLLLVERATGATAGDWMVPGGHVELGEHPHETAARELEEETGLVVDPADLALFLARTSEPEPGKEVLSVEYVVDRSATTGELAAATDAADARFWTPGALAAADETLRPNHADRFGTADLAWLLDEATATLDGTSSHP